MKNLIKILAVVGTGIIIGSVAGKFLKTERKQVPKFIKNIVGDRDMSKATVKENQDDLELYFI
jgi:hypothetical protein